jgi:uncharacterized protein YutE (UPF0331/DUF86 family)
LRNIITHEYLDIKWAAIKGFISDAKPLYEEFLKRTKEFVGKEVKDESTT